MAPRKSRTTAEQPATDPTSFNPAEFDRQAQAAEVVSQVAAHTAMPPENGHSHTAAVKKRARHQEHSKITLPAGDMKVHLLDRGQNEAGIAIRVEFPEGKDRPTAEKKEVIRSVMKADTQDGRPSGFEWKGKSGAWVKDIGADSPPARSVAIRLDAEARTERLAEALKAAPGGPCGICRTPSERAPERREPRPDSGLDTTSFRGRVSPTGWPFCFGKETG